MKLLASVCLVFVFQLATATASFASPVGFNFAGSVFVTDPNEVALFGASINPGDLIWGSFSFDPSGASADLFPSDPNVGIYYLDLPFAALNWVMASSAWTADGTPLIGFWGNTPPQFVVAVGPGITGNILSMSASSTIGGVQYQTNVGFVGYQAPNDALPSVLAPFNLVTIETMRMVESSPGVWGGHTIFRAQIHPSTAPVPEPAAWQLLAAGLPVYLGYRLRGRWGRSALSPDRATTGA